MENNPLKNRYCHYCNTPLKTIGIQRMNGSMNYCDSKHRKYHKRCYKALSELDKSIHDVETLIDSIIDKYKSSLEN